MPKNKNKGFRALVAEATTLGELVAARRFRDVGAGEPPLSQRQLADEIGISGPSLSQMIRGQISPLGWRRDRIAAVLGVTRAKLDSVLPPARDEDPRAG